MKKLLISLMIIFLFVFTGCNKSNSIKPKKYNATIETNYDNSVYLIGGKTIQNIDSANEFKAVTIVERIGYKYLYYEIDDIKYYDDKISISNIDKDITINVYSDYSLDDLPIVNIKTDSYVFSKYNLINMKFSLLNIEEELTDLSGTIKIRGNTTANLEKKPYAIKFDKKQSLFGLEKAKSWVLLADYLDPSALHNWCAFKLGNKFDNLEFSPTPNKVNLYLNDTYEGVYTLCEKVQENKGRLNIEEDLDNKEYTNLFDYNFLIEMEESVRYELDSKLNENYFYIKEFDKYIELKYPEKESFSNEEDYYKFFNELKDYVYSIFNAIKNNDLDFINQNLELNSLIDYLLVDLIMGETDHRYKSFYMYYKKDNQKLNFGPIWDYDFCLYVPWTYRPNKYYEISNELEYSNEFFKMIKNNDIYYNMLKNRYISVGKNNIINLINELKEYNDSILESLEANSLKWYSNTSKYENNYNFLVGFLENRISVFDKEFSIS